MYYDEASQLLGEDENEIVSSRAKPMSQMVKQFMTDLNLDNKKGYHKIYRSVRGKSVPIELFSSGSRGSTIRNAVSGDRYVGHLVGSKHEDFYYKVSISTGDIKNGDACAFFFDSPEEYEKHLMTTVDTASKELWREKQIRFISKSAI
jgi:hypothetical protein